MSSPGGEGIWLVFKAAPDSGGVAGPVPAMPDDGDLDAAAAHGDARTGADNSVASRHNAAKRALPVPRVEPAGPDGADPADGPYRAPARTRGCL